MNILIGILLLIWGLGLMAFGLLLFYALLPLWYGLFGGLVGYGLAAWIFGDPGWFGNVMIWVFAIIGAAIFAALAYQLEPFRRILAGVLMGFGLGSLVAGLFGGGGILIALFGIVGAVIFGVLVPLFFDPMIVVGSAYSGAALAMDGAFLILPMLGFFLDRTDAVGNGNFIAIIVWLVLGTIGLGWQLLNLTKWVQSQEVAVVGAD